MSEKIHRNGHPFIPYQPSRIPPKEGLERGLQFHRELKNRRSVRHFSDKTVPRELIEIAIRTAATAPSGAHRQPWRFVAVSDTQTRRKIRIAAEKEEIRNYESRMPKEWKRALEPLDTDSTKEYLEIAPWLVIVFAENHGLNKDGSRRKNYYVRESVGIACGLFIASIHRMGLCTLTHTPSPMRFLSKILNQPANQQPYILFPIGYPAEGCLVPDIDRKSLKQISSWVE